MIKASDHRTSFTGWLKITSVALILVIGLLEPLHQHSDHTDLASKAPCLICISSHSSAPAAVPKLLPLNLALAWVAPDLRTESYSRPHLEHPFTRPPPAI